MLSHIHYSFADHEFPKFLRGNGTLKGAIPVVCIRLMGGVLQSVTQLSVSNRWYVLDQQNYMFRQNRGHHQVCPK